MVADPLGPEEGSVSGSHDRFFRCSTSEQRIAHRRTARGPQYSSDPLDPLPAREGPGQDDRYIRIRNVDPLINRANGYEYSSTLTAKSLVRGFTVPSTKCGVIHKGYVAVIFEEPRALLCHRGRRSPFGDRAAWIEGELGALVGGYRQSSPVVDA